MPAGAFAILIVAVLLALAAIPISAAYRSASLHAADLAPVLLPAPLFIASLALFNEPAGIGWAPIAYPFGVLALAVAVLFVRVFLLPRLGLSSRFASIACQLLCAIGAIAFGALTPPFYE